MMDWVLPLMSGLLVGATGLALWRASRRRRLATAARRVEAPNSHYSSRGVRDREDRERWGRIDLAHLHPLNRDEVRRLLAVVDVDGIAALSTKERVFLDNMTRPRRGA
ncbi:MAG: hypothetical protein AB7T31_03445 [Gemmatimonadales bacterium]